MSFFCRKSPFLFKTYGHSVKASISFGINVLSHSPESGPKSWHSTRAKSGINLWNIMFWRNIFWFANFKRPDRCEFLIEDFSKFKLRFKQIKTAFYSEWCESTKWHCNKSIDYELGSMDTGKILKNQSKSRNSEHLMQTSSLKALSKPIFEWISEISKKIEYFFVWWKFIRLKTMLLLLLLKMIVFNQCDPSLGVVWTVFQPP